MKAPSFAEATGKFLKQPIAIIMTTRPSPCPTCRTITDGKARSPASLASRRRQPGPLLRSGSLPVEPQLESRLVGPTLGRSSQKIDYTAGVGLPRCCSCSSIIVLPVLSPVSRCFLPDAGPGTLTLLPTTLTLPGMAGLISIGMAVDANVIIFERIGRAAPGHRPRAMEGGFKHAFRTILTQT